MKVSFKVLLLVVLCAFVLAGCHGSGVVTILDNVPNEVEELSPSDLYISPGDRIYVIVPNGDEPVIRECRAISSYYTIENKIGATMYIIVGYSGPIVTDELEVPTDIWISDFYKVSTSKEKLKHRIQNNTYEVWDN